MKGSHPKLLGFFLKCRLFLNSHLVTQADRYHRHLLFLTIRCPFLGVTPLGSPDPHPLSYQTMLLDYFLDSNHPCQRAGWGMGGKGPASQAEHLRLRLEKSSCQGLVFKPGGGRNRRAQFGWPICDSKWGTAPFRCQRRWPGDHNRRQWAGMGMWCWPYPCPCSVPHDRSWLLVPNPSSQQCQRPAESTHKPLWLFSKDHLPLLLVLVFKCNYPQTYLYIYNSNLSQMSRRWLSSGLARVMQAAARDGEHAQRDPCLCLWLASACSAKAARQQPQSRRGFLRGAAAPRDALKGCNLKTGAVTENYNYSIY